MRKVYIYSFLSLVLVLLAVLMVATAVEQSQGSAYVHQTVYTSSWFFVLWSLLALLGIWGFFFTKTYRQKIITLLHGGLLLILLGAAVSYFTSKEGILHLRQDVFSSQMQVEGSSQSYSLPFCVRLDSFVVDYYPLTHAEMDYKSFLRVEDTVYQISSLDTLVSMNKVFTHKGYTLCQLSYDQDLKGSIFKVSYDPYGAVMAKWGFLLTSLGMCLFLFSRKNTFRRLLRASHTKSLYFLPFFLFVVLPMQGKSLETVSASQAEEIARHRVEYNNRIVPFHTVATEFMRAIYGKNSYRGLSAVQVLMGFQHRPLQWVNEPLIRVKESEVQASLDIKGGYASVNDLFDNGTYKLQHLSHKQKSKGSYDKLDQKMGLIMLLLQGSLYTPLADKEAYAHLSDTKIEAEILYNSIPFTKILFMGCLLMGFLSLIGWFWSQVKERRHKWLYYGERLSRILFYASGLFLVFFFVLRAYICGYVPLSNGYETMIFMALCLFLILPFFFKTFPVSLPFGYILVGFCLLVAYIGQMSPSINHLMPVLRSPLLSIHVSVIMVSYALFSITMLCALCAILLYFVGYRQGREWFLLTHLSHCVLYPAVFLLAIGIFLGSVWADVSWGSYWSWDPKEVWALITLLLYSIPLHVRSLGVFSRPLFYHAFMLCVYFSLLMTYFGVNYFLGGMHSYT